MIVVTIPSHFAPEIQYTFEILFEDFLGLNITFSYSSIPTADFIISNEGIKSITIKNQFFSKIATNISYISKENLPNNPLTWTDPVLGIEDLKILYGESVLEINVDEYILHADIISSSYFMLSRWEEIVDDIKDIHGRSTATNSIAFKYNFLHRPIVNEYADLLWNLLCKAGYTQPRKIHTYQSIVTHDVDQPYQWPNFFTSIKHLAGDLLKRTDLKLFSKDLKSWYQTKWNNHRDPFDNHAILLNFADRYGRTVYFNIIVSQKTRFDQSLSPTDPRLKNLIHTIEQRGHTIGFHPGYSVYKNQKFFYQELETLQSITQQKIVSGRQHYLRFEVPYTWTIWENAGMDWESSMGYSDQPGFRCGTCYSYTVFDCIQRKKLKLKEKPLILMDATLIHYLKKWDWSEFDSLKNQCKKHQGEWVTIWHNDLVLHPLLKGYEELIYT